MKQAAWCCVFLLIPCLSSSGDQATIDQGGHAAYRHAYYLFLAGAPNGCEDCYVPLLISENSLDQVAAGTSQARCVLLVTYERDSIWHDDGFVSIQPGDIQPLPRMVRLRSRNYRYQEITPAEVLKILKNPNGAIPVSRPYLPPPSSPGPSLTELVRAFERIK